MSSDDVVCRIWDFPGLQSNDVRRTKAARRESAKLLVKSSPIRAAARGCSSVGIRHCYINKRGSSRHRGFIGFQFAPNRTPPFLCSYHLDSPALTLGELAFPQRSRNHSVTLRQPVGVPPNIGLNRLSFSPFI